MTAIQVTRVIRSRLSWYLIYVFVVMFYLRDLVSFYDIKLLRLIRSKLLGNKQYTKAESLCGLGLYFCNVLLPKL